MSKTKATKFWTDVGINKQKFTMNIPIKNIISIDVEPNTGHNAKWKAMEDRRIKTMTVCVVWGNVL